MSIKAIGARKVLLGLSLLVLSGAAVAAWVERAPLMVWYNVRGLTQAQDGMEAPWIERLLAMSEKAFPALLGVLEKEDERACDRCGKVLIRFVKRPQLPDDQVEYLLGRLNTQKDRMSLAGRSVAALVMAVCLQERQTPMGHAERLRLSAHSFLSASASWDQSQGQDHFVDLAAAFVELEPEPTSDVRQALRNASKSEDVQTRLKAVHLAANPHKALLGECAKFLEDSDPEVRRAVMEAFFENPESKNAIGDDELLPWLNDQDPEVRRLCVAVLGQRGLSPEAIQLGSLITHPKAATRLEVLRNLGPESSLDGNTWVRHLSHDPSPAVRMAAMRAMAQWNMTSLSDRLDQMARSDPNPSVRQLAYHYLAVFKGLGSAPLAN